MTLKNKECLYCKKSFKAVTKDQKYCSISCSNKARAKAHLCKICGMPCSSKRKYCSDECRAIGYSDSRKVEHKKICPTCGKEFIHRENKYCSKECLLESRLQKKRAECSFCGNIFIKKYKDQQFCSCDCKWKAMRLPEKTCSTCGKTFHSNHSDSKYCSRECFVKSWEDMSYEEKEQRMAHLWNTPKTIISQPNLELKSYLETQGYEVDVEHKLGGYSYDLKIGNILIEVNPYPYHNVTRYPYGCGRPITKDYHHKKYLCAINNGYKCIMVWDWTTDEEVINMINDDKFCYLGLPRLHRYNPDTNEHIIDEGLDKQDMIDKGFVEIYDCGTEVFNS